MDHNEIKNRYLEFEKKFKLPGFSDVNADFEVDKIDRDSETFMRVVRKAMMEKVVNSMGFVDALLNPTNLPRIYFPYVKSMSGDDKKRLERIYNVLSDLSVASLALEIETSDKKEAEMIKKTFDDWNSIKSDFKAIVENIAKPNQEVGKKEKSYFG